MKKFSLLLALFAFCNLSYGEDYWGSEDVSFDNSSTTSGTSGNGTVLSGEEGETTTETCNTVPKDTVSLEFLKNISLKPKEFSAKLNNHYQPIVHLPAMPRPCIDSISLGHFLTQNTMFIQFKMKVSSYGSNDAENRKKSIPDQYKECMEQKGYFKTLSNGAMGLDKTKIKANREYKSEDITISKKLSSADYRVAFASPKNTKFNRGFAISGLKGRAPWKCVSYEKLYDNSSTYLLTDQEKRLEDRVEVACKGNDLLELLKIKADLPGSSLRTFAQLNDRIEGILGNSSDKERKKIMKKLKSLGRQLAKDKHEDIAREHAQKYVKELRKLEAIVIDPLRQQVDALVKQLSDGDLDEDQEKAAKKKMVELDKKIQEFAKYWGLNFKKKTGVHRKINKVLRKFGLTDEGAEINEIYLKSKYHSRVYKSSRRGGLQEQMSRSEANEAITSADESFRDDILPLWDRHYAAAHGDKDALREARDDMNQVQSQMYSTAYKARAQEDKYQRKYCSNSMGMGPSNPMACQRFMAGRSGRMDMLQRRLTGMERGLNGMQRTYGEMAGDFSAYTLAQNKIDGMDDPYAAYNLYDNEFGVPDHLYSLAMQDPRRNPAGLQQFGYSQQGQQMGGAQGLPVQYGMPMGQFGNPRQQMPYGYQPQMGYGGQGRQSGYYSGGTSFY